MDSIITEANSVCTGHYMMNATWMSLFHFQVGIQSFKTFGF